MVIMKNIRSKELMITLRDCTPFTNELSHFTHRCIKVMIKNLPFEVIVLLEMLLPYKIPPSPFCFKVVKKENTKINYSTHLLIDS